MSQSFVAYVPGTTRDTRLAKKWSVPFRGYYGQFVGLGDCGIGDVPVQRHVASNPYHPPNPLVQGDWGCKCMVINC